MLNEADVVPDEAVLNVIDWDQFAGVDGKVNISDETLLANVRSSIRRGHQQVQRQPMQSHRVVLVGGGPSLASSEAAIRELVWNGAKLITVNGAYRWCIEHQLQPRSQIVMDGRAFNAKFVQPAVRDCRYLLASQCHPDLWDAVEGREHVWLFHAATGESDGLKELLDAYYLKQWVGIGGGVTVICRAVMLLRLLGYLRFDLFGVDCCWLDGEHHAYDQPENGRDRRFVVTIGPCGSTETRQFVVSGWHLKQFENLIQIIRVNGNHFALNVHGDGLFAYAVRAIATGTPDYDMQVTEAE